MIVVVSDSHLKNREDAEIFIAFLTEIKKNYNIEKIILLGDIFDSWIEYYGKYISHKWCNLLSYFNKLVKDGIKIDYYLGNHDWWHKSIFEEIGVNIVREAYGEEMIGNKRFIFSHSDRLDPSFRYKFLLSILHNNFLVSLYRLLPPFVGDFFANFFSSTSRHINHQIDHSFINNLKQWLIKNYKVLNTDVFMFGHSHAEIDENIKITNKNIRFYGCGSWQYNGVYHLINSKNGEIEKKYFKE